jgi:aminoglycoside/choline kinase family phosphotransferase
VHERLALLFHRLAGRPPETWEAVAAHGSARLRWRLRAPGLSVIGTINADVRENRAFVALARHLRACGVRVPAILAEEPDASFYLEEDLGDTTLGALLHEAREGRADREAVAALFRTAAADLARLQRGAAPGLDALPLLGRPVFDARAMAWDIAYFKDCLLRTLGVPFDEDALQDDADALIAGLGTAGTECVLYRDFQSRNILVRDGQPWYIDFQGAKRGAPQYDLATLQHDSRAGHDDAFRAELADAYCAALAGRAGFDETAFRALLPAFAILRVLQSLGASGFRGFVQGRVEFQRSLPRGLANLDVLLRRWAPRVGWRALPALVDTLAARHAATPAASSPLHVHVISFSYRKGYPADTTGHGGGFVFDCRLLPNPGRDAVLAPLTGRDAAVQSWLQADPAVAAFLQQVQGTLRQAVASYQVLGYNSLVAAFGCTGGRHRSVYCAERTAAWLRTLPGVTAQAVHRDS